jgi:quinol monooxygenase YgiN
MLIIAGEIHLDPETRANYLAGCLEVIRQARLAAGCLDFTLSADPLDAGRINVYERWFGDADLTRFRGAGPDDTMTAQIRSASVHKYRIASVEAP